MTNPEHERLVNILVVLEKAGRSFSAEADTRWGGLLRPDPSEVGSGERGGLRIALFGSWTFGYLVLETIKRYERNLPGRVSLVGLVTDDPLNPDARISVKKRVWHLVEPPYRVVDETAIIEAGLEHGIPVYTGEIKVPSFRRLLAEWRPDVILVCVFGQIIDAAIIEIPRHGIYNFHPSDLSQRQGAGPAPYDDLAARRAETTVWSVHHVCEAVDAGHVIGLSPQVRVVDASGRLPADPLVVYEKLAEALGPLVWYLLDALHHAVSAGHEGAIENVDFDAAFPDAVKARLLEPIRCDAPSALLPEPDPSLLP